MARKLVFPDQNKFRADYGRYTEIRNQITQKLLSRMEEILCSLPSRPTLKSRTKDFPSYFKKYLRLFKQDAGAPVSINDIIGIRIICPFIEELPIAEELISKKFEVIEIERKGSNYSFKEFGYESVHILIKIPQDILQGQGNAACNVAEIQIRTILQDAWAEVEHELVYKAEFTPFDLPMKRKLAAVNASLSLADIIFQEIRNYQRRLIGQLGKRRESFFKKIEESTDALLFEEESPGTIEQEEPSASPITDDSIDSLLLNALYAHNKNQFLRAIDFYSRILDMRPDDSIQALIYKHRGMANFAQSQYEDAIGDFTQALELDTSSYKAAYYRGIVQAVRSHYLEAINDFSLSLSLNPYQPFCLYRRGQAYYHLEDLAQALADCDAALALDPKMEAAGKFRGLLLKKLQM